MSAKNNHKYISVQKLQTRHVRAPYKKWTDAEHYKILEFLRNNQPIEKPTAQTYYRRLMAEHGIDWDWRLFRSKVRNMRNNYFKLKMWAESQAEDEKSQKDLNNIEELLLKKCPLYYEFEKVFGKTIPDAFYTNPTNMTSVSNNWDTADDSTSEPLFRAESTPSLKMEFTASDSGASENEDPIGETGTPSSDTHSAMAALNQMLSRLVKVKRQKLQTDLDFKQKELQLQTEMFQFEKEKHYENMRLKEKEIENNEKIKIMELKTKETIALRELEMKERIELAKKKSACLCERMKMRSNNETHNAASIKQFKKLFQHKRTFLFI